jgi:hypothetical protein
MRCKSSCLVGFATWVNRAKRENLCQRRFSRFGRLTLTVMVKREAEIQIWSYNKSHKTHNTPAQPQRGAARQAQNTAELGSKKKMRVSVGETT